MSSEIKEKFDFEKDTKTFRLVDNTHHLDIFVGYNEDGFPCMVITTMEGRVKKVESSNSIEVKLFKKSRNEINLSFSLLDKEKETIFYKFCEDIIESSKSIAKENALNHIISRWNNWRYVFKRPANNLLSENEIVGLLGELIYLKTVLVPKLGYDKAIKSWMGPVGAHKDFEFDNTWHEIKTIRSSALTVRISSIEQLASEIIGYLDIVIVEKTSNESQNALNLNSYVNVFCEQISNHELKILFNRKLSEVGYFRDEEYDKYNYKFINLRTFQVNKQFPRILTNELKSGVVKVSYDILLDHIEKFECVGDEIWNC